MTVADGNNELCIVWRIESCVYVANIVYNIISVLTAIYQNGRNAMQ